MKALSAIFLMVLLAGQGEAQVIEGTVSKVSVNVDSVGCGIVKGRLKYIAKTTSEINLWPETENLRLETPVLEILGKRYPQNFQEDQGYYVQVVWELDTSLIDVKSFELQYPGMAWITDQGQNPQNVELVAEEGRIVLRARMNSYDYCMGTNRVSLHFKLKADNRQVFALEGAWDPELIL